MLFLITLQKDGFANADRLLPMRHSGGYAADLKVMLSVKTSSERCGLQDINKRKMPASQMETCRSLINKLHVKLKLNQSLEALIKAGDYNLTDWL